VLPQIEKFLESPEERRLRRIRAGLITGSIGFGASLGALFMTITDADFLIFLLPTLVLFFIGLGLMINGLWFTLPRKQLPEADLNILPAELISTSQRPITKNLFPAHPVLTKSSVTEHTTHHLGEKDVR